MKKMIFATILSSISLGAMANPWAVVCLGVNEAGQRLKVSDYRSDYQGRRLLIYTNIDDHQTELNDIEGLVSDRNKLIRQLETVRSGKRVQVKLTYHRIPSQLPADSDRNDELNANLKVLIENSVGSRPLVSESDFAVSCFRRTGGE